jgi:hypothetical protein
MSYEDPDPYGRRRPLNYRAPDPAETPAWRKVLKILGVVVLIIFIGIGLLFGACMVMMRR